MPIGPRGNGSLIRTWLWYAGVHAHQTNWTLGSSVLGSVPGGGGRGGPDVKVPAKKARPPGVTLKTPGGNHPEVKVAGHWLYEKSEFSDFLWEGTQQKKAKWKKGVSLLFLSFFEVG